MQASTHDNDARTADKPHHGASRRPGRRCPARPRAPTRRTHATAPTRARSRRAKGPNRGPAHAARGSRIDPAPWAAGIVTVTVGLWVLAGGLTCPARRGHRLGAGDQPALRAPGGPRRPGRAGPHGPTRVAGTGRRARPDDLLAPDHGDDGSVRHARARRRLAVRRRRRAHADVGRAGGPRDGDRVVRGRAGRRPAVRGREPHLLAADPDPDDLRDVAHGPPGRLPRRCAGLPARAVQRHDPGRQRRRALVVDRALRRHDGHHRVPAASAGSCAPRCDRGPRSPGSSPRHRGSPRWSSPAVVSTASMPDPGSSWAFGS